MGSTPSKTRKTEVIRKINAVVAMKPKDQNCNRSIPAQATQDAETYNNWSVHRKSIRADGHRLSYGDTTVAWNALRRTFKQHQRNISRSSLRTLQRQPSTDSETESNQSFYDNNPHLQYNAVRKIMKKEECEICRINDSRKEPLHHCRVCIKVYHHACLEAKGCLSDGLALAATAESTTSIGWSCPTCENLMNLLTDEEQKEVIESFEKMAGNATSIDSSNYLEKRRSSYFELVGFPMSPQREKQEITFFNEIDRNHSGTLEWWEYVPTMCIRILSRRTQEELLEMASLSEISRLEMFFKSHDTNGDGLITFTAAKMAYGKWLLSLVKPNEDGIIPDEWIGELPEEWIGRSKSSMFFKPKHQKETIVSWQDFLFANALHILCARLNTVNTRPFLPTIDDALRCLYAGKEIPLDENIEEEVEEEMDPIQMIKMRLNKSQLIDSN